VPSGKITSWRPAANRTLASATILRSAVAWPARSTAIILALDAYQPKNGIHISSFLVTKQLSGSQANWAKTSSMQWCLGAIRAAPVGMCWAPRSSTLMSQMTPSRPMTTRDQMRHDRTIQILGPNIRGEMRSTQNTDQM